MAITNYRIVGSWVFFPLEMQHFKGASSHCVLDSLDNNAPVRKVKFRWCLRHFRALVFSLLRRPCFAAVLRRRRGLTRPRLRGGGRNVHTGQHLLRRLSQHALHVADKAVDVALARRLVDDVLVVVVAQASTQLLVVHLGFVLALAPALGHLRGGRQKRRKWTTTKLCMTSMVWVWNGRKEQSWGAERYFEDSVSL